VECDVLLAGGWGYGNLGDELILRRYVDFFQSTRRTVVVASRSPILTTSQHPDLPYPIVSQFGRLPRCEYLVIGGGGYLNGAWRRQCTEKLVWLAHASRRVGQVVAHAIEARNFKRHQVPMLRRALAGAHVSVRDTRSMTTLAAVGIVADLVPDAIFLGADVPPAPRSHSVLNVMDVPGRADAKEAEFGMQGWRASLAAIAGSLGSDTLIAANDRSEAKYAAGLNLGLPIEVPQSPAELERLIGGARACVATRMHYGLFPLKLGVPSIVLPYNGKVRGALETVGLPERVASPYDLVGIEALVAQRPEQSALEDASERCTSWLRSAVTDPLDRRMQ
jgi:polysaccharide pyruvyl transferase WcaK-like protein